MKCQHCEKDTFMPFKCPFCSGQFCVEHRLPENHKCPELWRARIHRKEPQVIIERKPERSQYRRVMPRLPRQKNDGFWFSYTELKHLAFGSLLVMGVGASLFWFTQFPKTLVALSLIFTSSFLLHEIAHKLTAQYYGLWAEFRLTFTGVIITLLSIISPVKIISPGAVMVAGAGSRKNAGKVSLAGPLTNLSLASTCLLFTSMSPIFIIGCFFNAFMALINLLPFGLLDGIKVFLWNKVIWATAFILSIAVSVWSFIHIY